MNMCSYKRISSSVSLNKNQYQNYYDQRELFYRKSTIGTTIAAIGASPKTNRKVPAEDDNSAQEGVNNLLTIPY